VKVYRSFGKFKHEFRDWKSERLLMREYLIFWTEVYKKSKSKTDLKQVNYFKNMVRECNEIRGF
jgi:hypothetical protein